MRAPQFHSGKTKQQGAALMVMMIIIVMGALTMLVNSFNPSALKSASNETSAAALVQAKDALLGYAASDTTRPGELPCPDSDNDGSAEILSGNDCAGGNFGRLPWKTLGLPDLRDSAGERLWYAVSDSFHAGDSAVLNSDTTGTISISGNIVDSNVIAIVFAPGAALSGQDRSTANLNTYNHYLESVITAYTAFNLSTTDDHLGGGYTYNDQMTLITHDNLFRAVEKAVANHFKNAQVIETYHSTWGTLPFATASNDTYGLLPINGNAATPYWSSIQSTGDGTATCTRRPSTCSGSSCTYARCNFSGLSSGDVVEITGTIYNVGMGFWRPYDPTTGSSATSSCTQEVCVRRDLNGLYYPASSIMDNVSISVSLDSLGRATITFTGKVKSWWYIPNRIQFSTSGMPDYSSTLLDSWFADNDWQDVMYYAVSPGYVPGASNACNPLSGGTPPYCLTLNGNNGGADKRALVIMTGSALTGHTHPSANTSDYLEGENATPADYIFENSTRSSTFNDHVVGVSP